MTTKTQNNLSCTSRKNEKGFHRQAISVHSSQILSSIVMQHSGKHVSIFVKCVAGFKFKMNKYLPKKVIYLNIKYPVFLVYSIEYRFKKICKSSYNVFIFVIHFNGRLYFLTAFCNKLWNKHIFLDLNLSVVLKTNLQSASPVQLSNISKQFHGDWSSAQELESVITWYWQSWSFDTHWQNTSISATFSGRAE